MGKTVLTFIKFCKKEVDYHQQKVETHYKLLALQKHSAVDIIKIEQEVYCGTL